EPNPVSHDRSAKISIDIPHACQSLRRGESAGTQRVVDIVGLEAGPRVQAEEAALELIASFFGNHVDLNTRTLRVGSTARDLVDHLFELALILVGQRISTVGEHTHDI